MVKFFLHLTLFRVVFSKCTLSLPWLIQTCKNLDVLYWECRICMYLYLYLFDSFGTDNPELPQWMLLKLLRMILTGC